MSVPLKRVGILLLLFGVAVRLMAVQQKRTVWDGVYTEQQAQRGKKLFEQNCSSCHRPEMPQTMKVLFGDLFIETWREGDLYSLFDTMKREMPGYSPGSLSEAQYLDSVAFLLKSNSFPTARSELTVKNLPSIEIVVKDGPQPLSNGVLVESV